MFYRKLDFKLKKEYEKYKIWINILNLNQSLSQFGSRYSVFFPPPPLPLSPMGTYPPPSNLNIPVINYTMISKCGFNPIGHGVSTKMIHTGKFNLNNQLSKSESNIFWAGSKAGAHVWGVCYKQLWYQLFVTVCDHISAFLSLDKLEHLK